MKTLRFLLPLLILLPAFSPGAVRQTDTEKAAKSDAIILKMRQLDLLNHILPLLLTKAQLNPIITSIEKAREKVKLVQDSEYKRLIPFDDPSTDALNKALDEGLVPDKTLMTQMFSAFASMTDNRKIIGKANIDLVTEAVMGIVNDGQKRIMINQLDPKLFDPSLDPAKMSDSDKVRLFVSNIFLDPVAYDVLVKLSLSKHTPDK